MKKRVYNVATISSRTSGIARNVVEQFLSNAHMPDDKGMEECLAMIDDLAKLFGHNFGVECRVAFIRLYGSQLVEIGAKCLREQNDALMSDELADMLHNWDILTTRLEQVLGK